MAPSKFESLPSVILEKITISLIALSFLGPPTDILAVPLLSKSIWRRISMPHIFAKTFALKFDACAAIRRLGKDCGYVDELAGELAQRFNALKRLKNDNYLSPNERKFLRTDLWTAYLLFLENEGNNVKQLIEYARVDKFASHYVSLRGLLYEGANTNGGWIIDNENNALAMWLFWYTDRARVESETPNEREETLQVLSQLFIGSFKYSSTHAPITSFLIPPVNPPPPTTTMPIISLVSSPVSNICVIPDHFGFEATLAQPLIVPPALMSSAVRFEAIHSDSLRTSPGLMNWGDVSGVTGSKRHEHDWNRLLTCYDPWSQPAMRDRVFTPGMLHGKWVGQLFIIPPNGFEDLLSREQTEQPFIAPLHPLVLPPVPLQFQLREHHQRDKYDMVEFDDMSCDGTGTGVLNAWFPEGTTMYQTQKELRVHVPYMKDPTVYRTYDPATAPPEEDPSTQHQGLYGSGVWDIVLTAETEETFGEAWGHEQYYGRVRDWDGLVMLVRGTPESGRRWIFYGHVHGNQNLVGRWRETWTPVEEVGWSGVWCMTKEA